MLIRTTERVQNPTVEQIVSLPIAQIQEELVEVIISTRRSFPLMVALLQRGIICEDEVHVPRPQR